MQTEAGQMSNITATAQVYGGCRLIGFYVNSTSSGTIVFHNHASAASNAVSGTITPAIGFHRFPGDFPSGLHVVIANTMNVTLFYVPN